MERGLRREGQREGMKRIVSFSFSRKNDDPATASIHFFIVEIISEHLLTFRPVSYKPINPDCNALF